MFESSGDLVNPLKESFESILLPVDIEFDNRFHSRKLIRVTSSISFTFLFASATISSCLTAIFCNSFANLGFTDSSGTTVGLVLNPLTVPKGPAFCCLPNARNCF
ncbi:hypothetical protein Ahy_B03g068143 [Arachis hypogaea]|uniref:Uncharacterized protein n=1 Tax=Arachis hypogaea TaxID=3818 RepID=A0A445A8X5_ARAHY|nr:hypothetical protein Ahy_B03g068143 [Arachis hypogaea]